MAALGVLTVVFAESLPFGLTSGDFTTYGTGAAFVVLFGYMLRTLGSSGRRVDDANATVVASKDREIDRLVAAVREAEERCQIEHDEKVMLRAEVDLLRRELESAKAWAKALERAKDDPPDSPRASPNLPS